ncbi:MAG: hypothetical protein OXC84_13750 [Gammaproteobacteria bacterium]|nr:hypothetical protein [Gammaproteobacteria bacterium]
MKNLIVVLAITKPAAAKQSCSPCVDRDYPENVYRGAINLEIQELSKRNFNGICNRGVGGNPCTNENTMRILCYSPFFK